MTTRVEWRGARRAQRVPDAATVGDGAGASLHSRTVRCAKARRNQDGSTVVGLLIAIVVLAILGAVVVSAVDTTNKKPSVAGTTKSASVAACNQTVGTVQTALEAYEADTPTGGYPPTLGVLTKKTTDTPTNSRGPWLKQLPRAQLAKDGYAITYTAATGQLTVKTRTTTLPGTTATACAAA